MNIFFSIITVTLNSKEGLLKTINSVQSQNYKYFLHIIKDGLSEDGTNKIDFSKYKNINFFESKDKGVYDAMNQAFKFSKEGFIIYLNANDTFFSKETLKNLASNIRKNPNYNSYNGGTIQLSINENNIKRKIGIGKLYKYLPLAQIPHPSFVVKKSILSKLNQPFDSKLKIAADYKQQLNLRKKGLWKNCFLDQIISIMPIGGISNKNKLSVLNGYLETLIFSFKLFNIKSIYILIIKILLNFYSKINLRKIRFKDINYK
jgi:glycosyltransferase involved in cell wall biosynthesis